MEILGNYFLFAYPLYRAHVYTLYRSWTSLSLTVYKSTCLEAVVLESQNDQERSCQQLAKLMLEEGIAHTSALIRSEGQPCCGRKGDVISFEVSLHKRRSFLLVFVILFVCVMVDMSIS